MGEAIKVTVREHDEKSIENIRIISDKKKQLNMVLTGDVGLINARKYTSTQQKAKVASNLNDFTYVERRERLSNLKQRLEAKRNKR